MTLRAALRAIKDAYPACKIQTRKTSFFGLWEEFAEVTMPEKPILIEEGGVTKKVETRFFGLWTTLSVYDPEADDRKRMKGKTLLFHFGSEDGSWILNAFCTFKAPFPSIWTGRYHTLSKDAEGYADGTARFTVNELNRSRNCQPTDASAGDVGTLAEATSYAAWFATRRRRTSFVEGLERSL